MAEVEQQETAPAVTAASRYEHLRTQREPYLRRARDAAKLTIPALMPPEGYNASSNLYTPWQGIGARGVNNLAAKLLLALLPPGSSFFRLKPADKVMEELVSGAGGTDARGDIEKALGKIERSVVTHMEQTGARKEIFEALKQLIVCGNVLLHVKEDGGIRIFWMDKYVVKRDPNGEVLEILVKECLSPMNLPPEVAAIVQKPDQIGKNGSPEKSVDLYTRIYREDGKWSICQEVEGQIVEGTEGTYPLDTPAWLALRFTNIASEDYGRGYVEEYIGDLASLESLAQALVEIAAIAARVINLVDPGSLTDAKKLQEARNGEYVEGRAQDVTQLALEKVNDFKVAESVHNNIEARLAQAFLLNSSVQRNAERVTAEEIRFVAAELEQALGGVYSVLGVDFQLPLVKREMAVMQRMELLPALPKDLVKPTIVTGLEALGRTSDLQKLEILIAGMVQNLGQQAVSEYLNAGVLFTRKATALGLDIEGIVRSEDEVQQARQQARTQALAEKVAPQVAAARGQPQEQTPTQ